MTTMELIHHKGSLSAALKQYGRLRIEVLSQGLDQHNNKFIREVNLLVDNMPRVKARVEMSLATYQHFKEILDNLGSNSIGEALLFKYPFQRSEFQFSTFNNCQRRFSIFVWQQHQISVTEIFIL